MKATYSLMLALGLSLPASAVTTVIEDFDNDSANWRDTSSSFNVSWSASGGAPGASPGYATAPFAFDQAGSFGAVLFRGQAGFGSSGNAFVGDWVADGVQTFSAMVRHNAPVPLTFNIRFASSNNFPGASAIAFAPIVPGVWTELFFEIDPSNPAFVTFEGTDFDTVFSNIGNIQVGMSVPTGFETDTTLYTFDLDRVVLTVPEPATSLLALGGVLLFGLRRRR